MKAIFSFGVAALVLASVTMAGAADLKSGLQPGESVGAFDVEKCGGALNDNVKVGANLCYRCMLGQKPVVVVFARKADDKLAGLVKELDKAVAKNESQKLSSFVNLLGKDSAALKTQAKEFAAKNKIENVAVVVPMENENGPADYKVSPDAEVTVLIYREGKVVANHALSAGKLDDKATAGIIADTSKILK